MTGSIGQPRNLHLLCFSQFACSPFDRAEFVVNLSILLHRPDDPGVEPEEDYYRDYTWGWRKAGDVHDYVAAENSPKMGREVMVM